LPHLATATGLSAGCAPSGLALHRREHQGCRRGAQLFGDEDLLSRIVFHMKGGQELVMVGEMPVDRSTQPILLLYLDKRRRPKGTDPRQTKVGPEEKIPPLGCGAQHEH
jgi:hypothetical protein